MPNSYIEIHLQNLFLPTYRKDTGMGLAGADDPAQGLFKYLTQHVTYLGRTAIIRLNG